jgi:SAM-dependent methyltransferase
MRGIAAMEIEMLKPTSPLTGSGDVELVRTVSTEHLSERWRSDFGIDIASEFKGHPEVSLYECRQTKLRFFVPSDIAASGRVYGEMEKFDWYYKPHKWEHDVALTDLKGCNRILEVGCGTGAFLERIERELKVRPEGVELSSSAANAAIAKGLCVSQKDLEELLITSRGSYDAVCAFQVLEHVSDPLGFLQSTIKLLKPGGKLIIAVPNMDSFLRYATEDLPNQPPHHITHWGEAAAKSLPTLLPVRLHSVKLEPLDHDHVDWFISSHITRLPHRMRLRGISRHLMAWTLRPLLRSSSACRSKIKGHTLYFCLEAIG